MFRRFLPVAAGVLLLAAAPVRADDAEDQAEKAVQKLGGMVVRDDKDPAKPVIKVDLSFKKVTDVDLKALADLKGLRSLDLGFTGLTDAGLKELAGLQGLQTLKLGLGCTGGDRRGAGKNWPDSRGCRRWSSASRR